MYVSVTGVGVTGGGGGGGGVTISDSLRDAMYVL